MTLSKAFHDRVAPTVAGIVVAGFFLTSVWEAGSQMGAAFNNMLSHQQTELKP